MATIATRYKRSVMVVALPSVVAVLLVGGAFALREPWLGRGGEQSAPSVKVEAVGGAEQALANEFVTPAHPREELFAASWPLAETNGAAGGRAIGAGKIVLPPAPLRATAPIAGVAVGWIQSAKLGLDHGIEALGLTAANELESPRDGSYRVGWYPDYGTPGEGGNAVLSAHESWNHLQGPFYFMYEAAPGDDIAVELADGRRLRYEVMSNVRYEVSKLPMGELIWPSKRPASQEWLTLITCGGRIVYDATGYGGYLDRDVVVARRVS
ncbi:MAG: class F sortase [Dehalococcoidia bacterium]|nr:class F sortase [Dehalococcoidia bacterium]